MPMITLRYATPEPRPDLRPVLAGLAARLAVEELGKDPGVTAVLVEPADPEGWFVAGQSLAEARLSAFWLDIKITAGTNTKAETAGFVRAAFAGIRDLLGALHEESYVLVHAADGHAYGYGGRTQEGRWAASNPG
ncbi:tautomerase family protein [Roseomonas xinghualingensis]|uniref:tautomerase family protein n=1 Tax=Roseomonas xinghualingensis TaxID=2986475 RepID=UPI0021F11E57|nr:4-oxalocrotonate tautomerase family protein [Roseomonas sp. SXEYE001]MCV4207686.1 4-oxalocrotonate tautomerase family protein [Roseomonas sp. SXEYE001]